MAWVAGGRGQTGEEAGGRERCLALVLDPRRNATLSWDCAARLPFYVCQRRLVLPEMSRLEVQISGGGGAAKTHNSTIPDSGGDSQVTLPYDATFYSREGERPRSRRQVDAASAFPTVSCQYDNALVPERQALTLVKGGVTVSRLQAPNPFAFSLDYPSSLEGRDVVAANGSQLTRPLPLDPEVGRPFEQEGNVHRQNSLTDYYWCEVNDPATGAIRRSPRVFVRAQEVEMYAVSVAVTYSDTDRADLLLASLGAEMDRYGVQRRVDLAGEAGPFLYRVINIRAELSPRDSNRTVFDVHVFNKTVGRSRFRYNKATLLTARASLLAEIPRLQELMNQRSEYTLDLNIDPRSLTVRSIDICPSTVVNDPISGKTFEVPDTDLGRTYRSPDICFSNGEPHVTLHCRGDKLRGASWARFEPNQGCNFTGSVRSPTTDTLQNISISDISEETITDVVNKTERVLENIDAFVELDIVYFADIIEQTASLDNISQETGQKILELVDTITDVNSTILRDSNDIGNATNRIIIAVEDIGDKIVFDNDTEVVRLVSEKTAVEVWDLSKTQDDVVVGLELLLQGGRPRPTLERDDLVSLFEDLPTPTFRQTDAALFLQARFVRAIRDANPGKDVRLTMYVFAETVLFTLGRKDTPEDTSPARRSRLNTKVISARVTVDGVKVTDLGDDVVTTVYLPVVAVPDESRSGNSSCVFWDEGTWSQDGCRYNKTLQGRDVCVCDHLTNFAVLLDFYGQDSLPAAAHQTALSVITIIGLSLSIAGLSVTVLSFLLIKKLRQGRPQQTLFHMALAMLGSWVVFLAGFTRVESPGGCVAVAALLHYFILASFMWMLMEGLLQYLLFVKVLGVAYDNYILKTAVPAWGLPLIPVITILAIDPDLYRGGDQYCWMSLTPFYFGFLAPVALVMVINIVVYILVIYNICRRGNIGSSGTTKRAVGVRASFACFIALGLSWVFAFFAIEDARAVFQYLFTLTSTLQGFLVFLIFTARDPSVRAYWKRLCCRCCGPDPKDKSLTSRTKGSHGGVGGRGSDDMALGGGGGGGGRSKPHSFGDYRDSPIAARGRPGNGYSDGSTSDSQMLSRSGPRQGFDNSGYSSENTMAGGERAGNGHSDGPTSDSQMLSRSVPRQGFGSSVDRQQSIDPDYDDGYADIGSIRVPEQVFDEGRTPHVILAPGNSNSSYNDGYQFVNRRYQ